MDKTTSMGLKRAIPLNSEDIFDKLLEIKEKLVDIRVDASELIKEHISQPDTKMLGRIPSYPLWFRHFITSAGFLDTSIKQLEEEICKSQDSTRKSSLNNGTNQKNDVPSAVM